VVLVVDHHLTISSPYTHQVFLEPLRDKPFISPGDLSDLFSNIEAVFHLSAEVSYSAERDSILSSAENKTKQNRY